MESRIFYDVRAPELPSGVFDLRTVPAPAQKAVQRLVTMHAPTFDLEAPHLTAAGFVVVPEPASGPHNYWCKGVFELQRTIETTMGRRVPLLVKVERVYAFNFPAFQAEQWGQLVELFSQLPEWKGAEPYPHWFGAPDAPPPYVRGHIERGGLRVRGMLSRARWVGWDTWIRRNISSFPLIPPSPI